MAPQTPPLPCPLLTAQQMRAPLDILVEKLPFLIVNCQAYILLRNVEACQLRWTTQKHSEEELPHVRGQGQQPRGATTCPRSSGCAGTGGPRGATPHSRSGGVAVRRYPLVQGKEQWLHFAGAAVRKYSTSKVRETQVRR